MLATVHSACLLGIDGHPVRVEVHIGKGIPGFTIVGQPDSTCREARDRVRAAVQTVADWPNRKTTVNLAPSGLRKVGAALDLALALGLLVASQELADHRLDGLAFLGELGLDGTLRPVRGTLALVDAVEAPRVVVPPGSVTEARLVDGPEVLTAATLAELVEALEDERPWPAPPEEPALLADPGPADLAEVRGHAVARSAVEVSAAGGHHLLMVGPPGSGKTTLAHRLPGVLPPLRGSEALEATRIHSAAGAPLPPGGLLRRPPLRAPHHGASPVAMVGGGTGSLSPGEISLAHRGVLFLDEVGEFPVDVLEALRTPLEEGVVRVARANAKVDFPARFLLVAAMNPCPCGHGLEPGRCRCSDAALLRYSRRLSGPLLDRFDLRVEVRPADPALLLRGEPGEPSAAVAERVLAVRARSAERGVHTNAQLTGSQLDEEAPLGDAASAHIERLLRSGRLSPRGMRRIQCVALTLTDIAGREPPLSEEAVAAALALRTEPGFLSRRLAG